MKSRLFTSLLLLLSVIVSATTVNLNPSKDATIDQASSSANYGSGANMYIGYPWTPSWTKRGVIAFDLSGIPSGATITSANLYLYETSTHGTTRTIAAHLMTASWSEGSVTWSNANSSFNGTASASYTLSYPSDMNGVWNLTSDVQAMVNGGNNYGWMLKDNSEDGSSAYWQVGTKENSNSGLRPVLTVTYTTSINVTVSPSSATICNGDSTSLTASGGTTYAWSPSTGLSATTGSTVKASPTSTTTYTVIGTTSGVHDTTTVAVTVNSNPTVSVSPSTATICGTDSVSLTASGASTYAWSPSTGLSATSGATVKASPASTTTYTVIGTSGSGCAGTTTKTVTVRSLPTISVSPSADTICSGSSLSLSASGASTYSWSPATGLSSATIYNPTATVTANTTYTVTGTDAYGCVNTATSSIKVNANPYINISGLRIIDSATVHTQRWKWATQEKWFFGSGVFANFPQGTGAMQLSAINTNFSERIGYEGTATICDDNGNLLYYTNGRRLWKADNTLLYTGLLAGNEGGASPGNPGGITTSSVQGVLFVKHPSVDSLLYIFTTDDALTSTTQGLNYWILNMNTNSISGPTRLGSYRTTEQLEATFHNNGTDIWIATRQSGGSNKADFRNFYTYLLTSSGVNSTPVISTAGPAVNSSSFAADWERGSLKFSWDGKRAATVNDISSYSDYDDAIVIYDFNNSTGHLSNAKSVSASWGGSSWTGTTYQSQYDGEFSTDSKMFYVSSSVNGKLLALNSSLSTADSIYHSIAVLSTSVATAGDIKLGGDEKIYQATTGGTLNVFSFTDINTASGFSQTTIGLPSGTTSGRCFSNMFIPVKYALTVCSGTTLDLTASGASTYAWSPADGLNNTTGSVVSANPMSTTTYTVIGTSNNGCTGSASLLFKVLPRPTLTVSPDTVNLAPGDSVQLTASGAVTYSWSPSAGLNADNISNPIAKPSFSTLYTVTGTAANGCTNIAYAGVGINYYQNNDTTRRTTGAGIVGPKYVCEGDNYNYSLSINDVASENFCNSSGAFLQWSYTKAVSSSPNPFTFYDDGYEGLTASFTLNGVFNPPANYNYYTIKAKLIGCYDYSNSYTVDNTYTFSVIVVPNFIGISSDFGNPTVFKVVDMNRSSQPIVEAASYAWTLPAGWSTTASAPSKVKSTLTVYQNTSPGVLVVRLKDSKGSECSNLSINAVTSTIGVEGGLDFSIYPNPTSGQVNVTFPNSDTHYTVQIIDAGGKSVYYNSKVTQSKMLIDIDQLANGIYHVQAISGTNVFNGKFVVVENMK